MTHRRTAKKARTEEPDAQPPQPATEVVQEADQTTEMKTEPSDTREVDLSSSNSNGNGNSNSINSRASSPLLRYRI